MLVIRTFYEYVSEKCTYFFSIYDTYMESDFFSKKSIYNVFVLIILVLIPIIKNNCEKNISLLLFTDLIALFNLINMMI